MLEISERLFSARRVILLLLILVSFAAKAQPLKIISEDIQVSVDQSDLTVKKIFQIIHDQASLLLVYDESDIDLSVHLNIEKGKYPLKLLLEKISSQANLNFTFKGDMLLITKKMSIKKNETIRTKSIQTSPVSGVVRSAAGNPLEGVSIAIKGKNVIAVTDPEGKFSIDVPDQTVLVFTNIGYKDQEVTVNGNGPITVVMQPVSKELSDVIVVGYQNRNRNNLTGAASVVDVSGVSKLPVLSVDQALEGKVPGVRITQNTGQPGDGVSVRVRGVGTINNNDPLYIIDGVPTKDGINFLSANDIENIVVLKDASSAAIYGSRAANGVVVINTKKGKKGTAQINYSGYVGFQTHGDLPKMANTAEYVQLYNEAADNDNVGVTNPALIRAKIPDSLNLPNTDWLNAIFRNGIVENHQISVSGGSEKVLYYFSGDYFKDNGIIFNSWYERYSLLSKLDINVTDNLTIGNNINLAYSRKNVIGSSGDGYAGNGGSVVRYALFRTPAIPLYDSIGVYSDLPKYPGFFGDGYNPVALAVNTDNKENEYRVFGNIYGEYKILKSLKFKSDLGVDAIITDDKRFDENYGTNNRINNPSRLTVGNINNVNLIWNNTFTYNKVFNKLHNVSILAGTEAITDRVHTLTGSDRDFSNQDPNFRFIGNGNHLPGSTSSTELLTESALFSLFGNANYSYKNLYSFSASIRRDGSSRFGPDNKYGTFYSVAGAWNIRNQEWFRDFVPAVSALKIRASYGKLGNQEIPDYGYVSIIGNLYNYPFGNPEQANPGATVSTLGNPSIKWETSTQTDAGIDIGLWHDQLTFTVDYFNKITSDMLIPIPLPLIGGSANPPYTNAGKVKNEGLEVNLNYSNNDHALKYNIQLNFSTIANKVLSLSNDNQPIAGGRIDNNYNATLTAVGHPIGSFYLYEMEGIFQSQEDIFGHAYQGKNIQPGDVKFKDQNGDGYINDSDRVFLGSAIPKFTYGFTANLQYKNFDLSAFFQGQYGNKIYSQVNMDIEGFYRPFNVTQRVYDERWQGEGTSNTMPRVSFNGSSNNKFPSSRFLEDGSYVRLKNLQIGYTIPSKLLERAHIKGLRIYITGENLWTLTNFTGLDPEMTASDNVKAEKYGADVASGIDWGTYPSARSYIIGVNLNF